MASDDQSGRERARERASGRIWVEEEGRRRPFMRGIMIHSLMARGVAFEDAFRTANQIRDRLRGRHIVSKEEIRKAVRQELGDVALSEEPPLAPRILVTGRGSSRPFSKGILSQSLLAAALEPNEAFEVARHIERDLVARGAQEIERDELRALARTALAERAGIQAAERYLAWLRHKRGGRPVIVLLGGASGVGKTTLGLEVAHRLGISRVLSTDSIRQIMRIVLSADLMPALHASSYDAWRRLAPEALGEDRVLDGFRAQAATVSVGVRASMERSVAENASLVLDGVSIVPGLMDLVPFESVADVFFLVVATFDEDAFATRFASREEGGQRRPPHRYVENLDAILRIQDHFLELADRYDVPIVDNFDLDRSVRFIVRHVAEAIRMRGERDEQAPG